MKTNVEALKLAHLTPDAFGYKKAIGVEIECFSTARYVDDAVPHWARWGGDCSIEAPTGSSGAEFRLLLPKNKFKARLNEFGKFLISKNFIVNGSCGLHIHLDMRHLESFKAYLVSKKLNLWLNILKGLVQPSRRINRWCSLKYHRSRKYQAVNFGSFYNRRTIEVRLYQGTTDTKEIASWISLLNAIVKHGKTPKSRDCLEALMELPLKDEIKIYWKEKYLSYIPIPL